MYSLFSVLIFLPSSFVNELRQLQMFPIWQHLRPRLCSWAVSLGEACKQGCPGSASLFVLLCSLEVTGRRRGETEPVLRLIRAFWCWFPLPLLTKGPKWWSGISHVFFSTWLVSAPAQTVTSKKEFPRQVSWGSPVKIGWKGCVRCFALVFPSNGTATFDKRFAPLVSWYVRCPKHMLKRQGVGCSWCVSVSSWALRTSFHVRQRWKESFCTDISQCPEILPNKSFPRESSKRLLCHGQVECVNHLLAQAFYDPLILAFFCRISP